MSPTSAGAEGFAAIRPNDRASHRDIGCGYRLSDVLSGHPYRKRHRIPDRTARRGDRELGDAIERSHGDLDTYSTYPEAVEVISRPADHGIDIAIVSDFHVDLRPHLVSLGLLDRIAGFALSHEVGATKPGPQIFQTALDLVSAPPERCLMVGDNPHPDGGTGSRRSGTWGHCPGMGTPPESVSAS
ncbi:MAG: HAD-IA family hydrolase [Actinomycetia bacterium]|nr:HAD-IA family hydrolase [Actinomycetes bacterium]